MNRVVVFVLQMHANLLYLRLVVRLWATDLLLSAVHNSGMICLHRCVTCDLLQCSVVILKLICSAVRSRFILNYSSLFNFNSLFYCILILFQLVMSRSGIVIAIHLLC